MLLLELLLLLFVANGMPVIGRWWLGERFGQSVDAGCLFFDGQPLFGPSKTVRGIALAAAITPLAALALGLSWQLGVTVALGAMAGDLLSSFIKRRLRMPPSAMALGLDQIPEALLPLILVGPALNLRAFDLAIVVVAFFAGELLLSRLLYQLHIRKRPY